MDSCISMLGNIRSREDLLTFMELYIPTIEDASVRGYLESVAGWIQDMDGYYANMGKEPPADIDWDLIATMLFAGDIYE